MFESIMRLFLSDARTATNDAAIAAELDNRVMEKSQYLGGVMSVYDGAHVILSTGYVDQNNIIFNGYTVAYPRRNNSIAQLEKMEPGMNPDLSSIRAGYQVGTCERILAYNTAVTTFLARRGLATTSTFTEQNIDKVFQTFVPGRQPPRMSSGTIDAYDKLAALGNRATSLNASNMAEGWRYVLYSICISSVTDLL
jgi:hypothetical protein